MKFWAVICGILAGCLTGCSSWKGVEAQAAFFKELNSRKVGRVSVWKNKSIRGEGAMDYVESRRGLLVTGDASVSFEDAVFDEARGISVGEVSIDGLKGSDAVGTAVAISADGYFLTAAHNVDLDVADTPIYLVLNGKRGLRKVRARVVWWNADRKSGGPDVALLHAEIRPARSFDLADFKMAEVGEGVITSGYGYGEFGHSAGRVLKKGGWRNGGGGVRWMEIEHDMPIAGGDSGSAVVNGKGGLVGVNSKVKDIYYFNLGGRSLMIYYKCVATLPTEDWLTEVMRRDRERGRWSKKVAFAQ